MFYISSLSNGRNLEQSTSSSDASYDQEDSGEKDDDRFSDDDVLSALPNNSSFQLPVYFSSSSSSTPTSTHQRNCSPAKLSTVQGNSISSGGPSSISTSSQDETAEMAVQRLAVLAKHPNANQAQGQMTHQRRQRKEELAKAMATEKVQNFRRKQHQHEDQQKRRRLGNLSRSLSPEKSPNIKLLIMDESASEAEEVDEKRHHQIVFQSATQPFENSSTSSSQRNTGSRMSRLLSHTDASSVVMWQTAIQETPHKRTSAPLRITFQEKLPYIDESYPAPQPEYYKEGKGMLRRAITMFGKIFPTGTSETPPSSGASIRSDNLDTRSVNSANKSLASKASLPSYFSEQTRKVNNLTPKDTTGISNMNRSMEHQNGENVGTSGFHRLISSRTGLIILLLFLVVLVAIIVTVVAALSGGKHDLQQDPYVAGDNHYFASPEPTRSPAGQSHVEIPTLPSIPFATSGPSVTNEATTTSVPTELHSTASSQQTPVPTSSSTSDSYPSSAPIVSQPSLNNFTEWTWTQRGLSLHGNESGQRFGNSVAISEDGKVLAIGSPYSTVEGKNMAGTVHTFQWDDTDRRGWVLRGILQGRNEEDQFGSNVALSADGTVIAVSEPTHEGNSGDRSGNVRVFVHNPFNGYSPLGQDLEGLAATDHLGIGLSISADGRRIAVGAPYHDNTGEAENNGNGNNSNRLVSGHARVFEWLPEDNSWVPIGKPMKGRNHLDWFGWSVDLNDDGSIVCVGAPRNVQYGGYVQCFEETLYNGGNYNHTDWKMLGKSIDNGQSPLRYDDNFGAAVAVSGDPLGNNKHRIAIGSPGKNRDAVDTGIVVVYEYSPQDISAEWVQLGQVIDSKDQNNQLGASIDLQGDLLVVGVPGASSVNLYRFLSETRQWERHPQTLQGLNGSDFGTAVRLTPSGDVVLGCPQSGDTEDIGTAHVYNTGR
jgi:hypothetical protein